MKSANVKKAADDISELIGAEFSEEHLYLESIVTSNTRLRLEISKVDSVIVGHFLNNRDGSSGFIAARSSFATAG